MHVPTSKFSYAAWVAVVALVNVALAPSAASAAEAPKSTTPRTTAAATASPSAAPSTAAPGEIADIKAQMAALKVRLDLVESQQEETARATFANIEETKKTAAAVKAPAPNSVRIGTAGINARLYGLIEATTIGLTHTNAAGAPGIGMNTPWFSGSRWGLDVSQHLYTQTEGQPAPTNKLDFIAKLESEFELPSGNMDTPGVLFNRDAWVGIQSKAFGKMTVGRQNALPRDVAQIWGDPYGGASNTLNEGGFTNTNNFKQLIYYASGGNSAKGQGDTRYDQAIVWKKLTDGGLFTSLAYNFGDTNGPGGPLGTVPISGGEFNKGSSIAAGLGFNAGNLHTSAFYTSSNVLEPKTISSTNIGHQAQSGGIGANYDWTRVRLNGGMIWYTGDQGVNGRRYDQAWTFSGKFVPTRMLDFELGVQEFIAHNAAVNGAGYVIRPFRDSTTVTKPPINGTRFTLYGSIIVHPVPNLDLYLAADDLLTGGRYLDSAANGFRHVNEYASGARFRF